MRVAAFVALDLVLILAAARLLRGALARASQPPVMGDILAGLALGASGLGALPGDPSAALFPEAARSVLGAAGSVAATAYLFTVGARFEPRGLRRDARGVVAVAAASFLVPCAAGAGLGLALHGTVTDAPPRAPFALFIGVAFGVTAVPVLARIVDARGLRDSRAGRLAVAAATAQELLVWPALAVAVALADTSPNGASPIVKGAAAAAALGGTVVLARVLAPAVATPRSSAISTLALLAGAAAATHAAGLHLAVGAVVFGVALPAEERAAALTALRARPAALAAAATLPLFFALPALRADVGALGTDGLALLVAVLAVAVAAKFASATIAAARAGFALADARMIGALMNARGLVELVVLTVGFDVGLIDARWFAVLVAMALLTTFVTGPVVQRLQRTVRVDASGTAGAAAT